MGVVFLFKADNMKPQPCVTATPLSLEERRLRHVSKDEGVLSWLETAQERLLTIR